MSSKASPREQDMFAMRLAARQVTYWTQSLEQADSGVEMRHAQATQALRQHMPVAPDPETQAKVKRQGLVEQYKGVNYTQYHLDEVNAKTASVLIGVSRPPANHTYATATMEGLHASRLTDAVERLQTKGWNVTIDATKRPKGVSGGSMRRIFRYMRVGMPTENGADTMQGLIADLQPTERSSFMQQLIKLPSVGAGSFTSDLLENPYDPARLIDNEIAARVIAKRIQLYAHEKEPLEQFAEAHGITQAVKALGRGGSRELGS